MTMKLRGMVPLLEVASVHHSVAFYRNALGFEVYQSAGTDNYLGWAWLKCGDLELMLNAMFEPNDSNFMPDPSRVQAHRDTTLFIGCVDIDSAYDYLRGLGLALESPVVTHYGMKQLSFRDPDGYGICLQWQTEAERDGGGRL